ncbi:RNA polymerase sigma factor [Rhodovibrio salinarum]|uniref:RNA polymerase sigma factor n=1 Tax=Rhodovibrio salinarum TaxID=1087 RepID=A0A934UZ69_9PROT|nr:RNA polymerase sigma factor [Rhodovibrio salinarum]MBK1696191.1 RNA polymerase sigma factor [Rhodovibrio salinarum]
MQERFEIAVARELPAVRRYAATLAHDRADADDLAQDTLERALMRPQQYREGTHLRAWLYSILRSRFFNQRRDAVTRSTALARRYPVLGSSTVDANQEAHAELREISSAMQRLSDDHLAVLQLTVLDGCSYEETARRLSMPVGTVRSRLARARQQLQADQPHQWH